MNIQFQYPEAFWLLLLVPVLALLYGLYQWWRKKLRRRIGDEKLVAALTGNYSPAKAAVKSGAFLLAFIIGCVAMANPRRPDDASAEVRRGIDVVLALDVSNSMLATDVPPNRLTAAQRFLTTLIDKLPNDRIGLVVFAGNAYTQMPLSTDHEAAKLFVGSASPNSVPEQGTSVDDALRQSAAAFDEQGGRFKTIVLVTDGETWDEEALSTANQLAKNGVMVNTVGLGSATGATLMDTALGALKKDETGATVVSKLNEALLQQIATATAGRYVHLENMATAIPVILDQYKNVEKRALTDTSSLSYETFYWWLLLPMFILLVTELLITNRKKTTP